MVGAAPVWKTHFPVRVAALAVTILGCQLVWIPIGQVFGPSEGPWLVVKAESVQLGAWYNQTPYAGHALAVPQYRPDITYGLARYGGVEGRHLVSEMYDPFAYLPSGYRYEDHQSTVTTLVECWLKDTDIRLIAIPQNDANYALLQKLNPSWFIHLGSLDEAGWTITGVSAPPPAPSECKAARSASR